MLLAKNHTLSVHALSLERENEVLTMYLKESHNKLKTAEKLKEEQEVTYMNIKEGRDDLKWRLEMEERKVENLVSKIEVAIQSEGEKMELAAREVKARNDRRDFDDYVLSHTMAANQTRFDLAEGEGSLIAKESELRSRESSMRTAQLVQDGQTLADVEGI